MGNYFIYITTNPAKTVLYIGMTNDLTRRISEHQEIKEHLRALRANSIVIY